MQTDKRLFALLPWLLAMLFSLLPLVGFIALVTGLGGGGHPSLGGMLGVWAAFPTLSAYLSRTLGGTDFPPPFFIVLGSLEYTLIGYGIGSLIARLKGAGGSALGIVALVGYVAAQVGAHAVLNQQSVNLRLLADPNRAVSRAAVARIAASGDSSAVPALHDRFVQAFEDYGNADEALIVALTKVGGAKGWQDLLESGRFGVRGNEAHMWHRVIRHVRSMADPEYAAQQGGVRTTYLRGEDIARLSDALASRLAERVRATPDADASLALIGVMYGRRDLCAKYFAVVPNGLRDQRNRDQRNLELARVLAAIKGGQSPDAADAFIGSLSEEDVARLAAEPAAVADEWVAWAASDAAPCRTP